MFDLSNFCLSDMVQCSAALRRMADGASSMEEAANRMVGFLYRELGNSLTAERSCALVRLFKTHPLMELPPDIQAFARRRLGTHKEFAEMKCLTLLATAGDLPEWNSRRSSTSYQGIPLAGSEFVAQFPMVAQLLTQFGGEVNWLPSLDPGLLVDLEQRTYNVFYVPEARGSSYVPAQDEFVLRYGIKSVLGIGGLLPSGHPFAIMLFSKVFIPRETADLFRTLAVSVKAALLSFDSGCVFAEADAASPVAHPAVGTPAQHLRSQASALEQLLEVHERTAQEQAVRLEQALEASRARVRQQEALAELGRRALAATDLDAMLHEAVAIVSRALELPYGTVMELLPDGKTLMLRAACGYRQDQIGSLTASVGTDSQSGYAVLINQSVVVRDLRTESRFRDATLLHEQRAISGVTVLLHGLDHPYGVLSAHSDEIRIFTDDEVHFLEGMAPMISGAIQRLRMEQALEHIVETVSARTGRTLFDTVVQSLAETLAVDYTFIGELVDAGSVTTLAAWRRGRLVPNFSYSLPGSPCANIVERKACSYSSGVRQAFPEDRLLEELEIEGYAGTPLVDATGRVLGLIVLLHGRPLRNVQMAESMLRICAARAGAELDRIRAEHALKESENRMRMILNNTLDAVIGMDCDGRITDWNPRAETMFGWTRSDALGKELALLIIPPFYREAHARGLRKFLDSGEGPILNRQIEMTALRRDGHEFPVELTVSALPLGQSHRFNAFVADISERKRLEAELRQAHKMEVVGRLAGGVAHDFNNLLTAILGYCQLLESDLAGNPACESVWEIRKAGDRAAGLTQQLLAFSRQQVLQPKILDLNAVVDNMTNMLRRLIGEHITLVTRLSADLGRVKADPGQVEQVLLNLVLNARDAMPEGGWLTVETANVDLDQASPDHLARIPPGSYVRLKISDTGHGMDEKTMAHIFEPFFTTKEVGKGTGLGLATVYGIIKQSDGFLWAESELKRGSAFTIHLPRLGDLPQAAPGVSKTVGQLRGHETILLIEDEPMVRRLTRRILEQNGYTVLEAQDGVEGLKLSRTHTGMVHLLITDAVMPFMSGRDVAQRLCLERPDIAVLLMSGHTGDMMVGEVESPPFTGFLPKPFTPVDLLQKVRAILST